MNIGFDCGTYNLVMCKRGENKEFVYKREVNAFIELPLDNRFVFNMMKKAGVPLVERTDAGVAYALGEAAVNMAYSMNGVELKRPMKDGCLNPKEKFAQQIMSIMMHGMIDDLDKNGAPLCYSVPANAVNEATDAKYHGAILRAIFDAFEDSS
jgi:actin-like ATPase involved in cell morphogenesis